MLTKWIAFFVVVLFAGVMLMGQNPVKDRPEVFGWKAIFHTDGAPQSIGASDGQDTSLAFLLSHFRGAVTLWLDPDSTGGNGIDSCATIRLQLRNKNTGEWGNHYSTNKLDTIARTIFNVGPSGEDIYFPLPDFDQFSWADSGRILTEVGHGDATLLHGFIGGQ
jgi:hypothetical protein